jgi:hypothetical protein
MAIFAFQLALNYALAGAISLVGRRKPLENPPESFRNIDHMRPFRQGMAMNYLG